MDSTTEVAGEAAWITPHGDIDFSSLPSLRAAAARLPAAVTSLTWDLRDVSFLDLAGLHLLAEQANCARLASRALSVIRLQPQPRRLLKVATELFPGAAWSAFA
ncbi:STAS domain-containing protein [Streptomyces sp. NPDC047097]|uniref:STAS domain-containing protein n=1 Tax=Streptomyces sp. NPDC047097 TaxID=3155260 RepID=UPI0033F93A44